MRSLIAKSINPLLRFTLIVTVLCSCKPHDKSNQVTLPSDKETVFEEAFEAIDSLNYATATICNSPFIARWGRKTNLFIISETDTVFKFNGFVPNAEFVDFDQDGCKDILIHHNTNVPGIYDLALFMKDYNTFKLVENFSDYSSLNKIRGSNKYYSYHRSGCADYNWDSDLFYIKNGICYTIGNISGRGCHDEKNGIFISRVKGEEKTVLKEILRDSGYYEDKC